MITIKQFLRVWLPVLSWAGLIFALSSFQYPEKTAVVTDIQQQVDQVDIPGISIRPLLPQQTMQAFLAAASDSEAARRIVHTLLFLVLGLLMMRAVCTTTAARPMLVSWLAGTLYGLSDEIHQIFTPGRTFQLLDLLVDSLGVLAGVLLYQLMINRKHTQPKPSA